MARRHKRKSRRAGRMRIYLSVAAVLLIFVIGTVGARFLESWTAVEVENAGQQMTAHTNEESTAQVFMNNQWYQKKNVETLLVMGIDNYGAITGSSSYNNTNQADFLVLFVRDTDTGESKAIHLNRDTMTDITMLGVTGEAVGVQHAQLALAYNYGRGENDSSRNTANAVENLLYGMKVDHYITVTMKAVPIMNDWAGGVEVEISDDFSAVDEALVQGETIRLQGDQALTFVRTRLGMGDSTNINRMERQRKYASAWVDQAQMKLRDTEAVAQLVLKLSDYHYSDCTADEMAEFANELSETPSVEIYELPGEATQGEHYIEYYVDEAALQQLVLEVFFEEVLE